MDKCNKIKNTCGSIMEAECINYDGTVNTQSSLNVNECPTVGETTQDIYTQLEEINLSALGSSCLTYVETLVGKKIVKNVLLKFEDEICILKTEINNLKNRPLNDMPLGDEIDTLCLVDDCGEPISTWSQLIQIMITNQCTP